MESNFGNNRGLTVASRGSIVLILIISSQQSAGEAKTVPVLREG